MAAHSVSFVKLILTQLLSHGQRYHGLPFIHNRLCTIEEERSAVIGSKSL